jgi:hypothetical protein
MLYMNFIKNFTTHCYSVTACIKMTENQNYHTANINFKAGNPAK